MKNQVHYYGLSLLKKLSAQYRYPSLAPVCPCLLARSPIATWSGVALVTNNSFGVSDASYWCGMKRYFRASRPWPQVFWPRVRRLLPSSSCSFLPSRSNLVPGLTYSHNTPNFTTVVSPPVFHSNIQLPLFSNFAFQISW